MKLTVEPTKSKLHNLTLFEPIDPVVFDKLLISTLLKDTFNNKIVKKIYENELQQLQAYKKLIKKNTKKLRKVFAKVKYSKVKGMRFGRSNPEGGLGLYNIRREIRHTLAKHFLVDIDVKNCHPVILSQILKHNNLDSIATCLNKYIENRDDYLQQVSKHYGVTKDDAKVLFIRLLYCGGVKNWRTDSNVNENIVDLPFVEEFKKEFTNIASVITNNNPLLKKEVEKHKLSCEKDYNINGSTISFYLQEYECRILEQCYLYCVDNDYIVDNIAVLAADGLMITKEKYNPSLLTELEGHIKETLGFGLSFVNKQMDMDYLDILDSNLKPATTTDDITEDINEHDLPIQSPSITVEQKIRWEFKDNNELLDYTLDLVLKLPGRQYYIRECWKYLMALPLSYSSDHKKLMNVGMALRNTADNSIGYLMWMCFCAKSDSFSINNMFYLLDNWKSFSIDDRIGLKTIMHWCKTDVPEEYNTIRHHSLMYLIDQTIYNNQKGAGDFDIAKIVAKYLNGNYVCADVKLNIWYEFKDHYWHVSDSASSLRNIISTEIRDLYIDKADSIWNDIEERKKKEDLTEKEQEDLAKKRKIYNKVQEIIQRLGKTNDKKNLTTELRDILKQDNFIERLDTNRYLLCCSNGVVDLKQKVFRDGRPDDMISLCTNVAYVTPDKINPVHAKEMWDFIEQVLPFQDTRNFVLDHLTSCLFGTQQGKPFTNYIGNGSNAKTVLLNFMKDSIGGYAKDFSISLITQKRPNTGAATPEMAALRGIRLAIMVEPSIGDIINEGIFKSLLGGDPITTRNLFSSLFTFVPQFKLILASNCFLGIKSNDDGTWRRISVVDFVSKFLDNPDPENELQFKKDPDIQDKMKNWYEAFLSFLINNAFVTEGRVPENELVNATTNGYRNKQNRVGQFINENIVKCENGRENKLELSRRCNEWFEMNYRYRINNKQLFDILDQSYDSKGNTYYGLKLINSFNNEAKQPKTREECFIEDFDRYFEVTHNSEDFIKSIRISEWAKIRGLKLDTSKTINPILLDKYGLDVKNKEHYKLKKIDGRPVQVWLGIKERTDPLPETVLPLTNHFISIDGITDFDTEQEHVYEIVEED